MKSLSQKVRGKGFWNIQPVLRISMVQSLDYFLVFIRYIATAEMCKKIKVQSGKNSQ